MNKKFLFVIFLIFALGIAVLLYPFVSAIISKKTSTAAVEDYQSTVKIIDTDTCDKMLADAQSYNAKLAGGTNNAAPYDADSRESAAYLSLLNVDGVMGYLDIPSIEIHLPIYHGVSEETLQKGVGHLPESSVPVGGSETHAVLSAHCGLPNARLFTDLDRLQRGDLFFVHVLTMTLAYQIDQIEVVLPEEVDTLAVIPGGDFITLLTCTPYGINSHRLLVRGTRVPYVPEITDNAPDVPANVPCETPTPSVPWLYFAAPAGIVPLMLLILYVRKKRNKSKKE
ncbi:MAG: class C sortase [Ruthenibacterium sp.]